MTTEERLEALERKTEEQRRGLSVAKRRNKYLLIGLVILAIAWAFTSTTETVQAQAGGNIIQAEGFELVDSQGHVRAMLSLIDNEPRLTLFSENGTLFVSLGGLNGEPGQALALCDENGMPRIALQVRDSEPELILQDENGMIRAGLVIYNGEPQLSLFGEDGVSTIGLGVSYDGSVLAFGDKNGVPRASIGFLDEYGSRLELNDRNGRIIWSAP